MRFLEHYKTLTKDQREALAASVGTSPAYLSQIAYGHRRPGGALTLALLAECPKVRAASESFGPPAQAGVTAERREEDRRKAERRSSAA